MERIAIPALRANALHDEAWIPAGSDSGGFSADPGRPGLPSPQGAEGVTSSARAQAEGLNDSALTDCQKRLSGRRVSDNCL